MFISNNWKDFEIIDASNGEKLERWGDIILIRPDPQVVWEVDEDKRSPLWKSAHARYIRSSSGGGEWQFLKSHEKRLPKEWKVCYNGSGNDLTYKIKAMGFKHTGLFPEQATNWDWFSGLIKNSKRKDTKVLNLFAYTGGATIAAAAAGASVCHVDAAKGMVEWAKENAATSGLAKHPIRYIVDDVLKFVAREVRRGNKYDGIIMDPPSYGRGPNGEVWKIENELFPLVKLCMNVLSDNPLFFLINSYTTGLSSAVTENILKLTLQAKYGGTIAVDEVGLPITNGGLLLPCGNSGRWQFA
ncbi:MAG: class I SAM-dependent methyltransferase [Oscillospiraceae bacterium]|nr:class I SAM-dependent methyltransferase [Oscillospiraceae bacterium]